MHEGIEHSEEAGVTPGEPANARPARQRQDAMVHHVEEAATVPRPSGSYWCNQDYVYVQGGEKKSSSAREKTSGLMGCTRVTARI